MGGIRPQYMKKTLAQKKRRVRKATTVDTMKIGIGEALQRA